MLRVDRGNVGSLIFRFGVEDQLDREEQKCDAVGKNVEFVQQNPKNVHLA